MAILGVVQPKKAFEVFAAVHAAKGIILFLITDDPNRLFGFTLHCPSWKIRPIHISLLHYLYYRRNIRIFEYFRDRFLEFYFSHESQPWRYCPTLLTMCLVTHAGCIAAGVGRAFSRVCLFVCLSVCRPVGLFGQGHTVTKTVTVARLLVTRTAAAGVGLHVDTTAYFF